MEMFLIAALFAGWFVHAYFLNEIIKTQKTILCLALATHEEPTKEEIEKVKEIMAK